MARTGPVVAWSAADRRYRASITGRAPGAGPLQCTDPHGPGRSPYPTNKMPECPASRSSGLAGSIAIGTNRPCTSGRARPGADLNWHTTS
ncbi:MAG TPA: hypothetical protein VH478_05900 [Trebonia sp.]|nr:hypothetical protein [Trebonia sp.]